MSDRAAGRVPGPAVLAGLVVLALVVALLTGQTPDEDPGAPGIGTAATEVAAEQGDRTQEQRQARQRATLGIGTGWGPSGKQVRRAVRAVRRMSLPDLAGQVIVADYNGTAAPTGLVEDLHLGGLIVFDRNVSSSAAMRAETRALKRAVDRPWPLWISVDQEGGLVERVQHDLTRFPSFMSAGATRPRLVRAAARGSGRELAWLGVTADFAPVADVTAGPGDPTIGSRSASEFTRRAADAVTAASRGFLDAGVVPVIKHFPGHGAAPADSHLTLPVLDRSMRGLRTIDLLPFRRGIAAGLPAVMVGHLDVQAVDPGRPSSLSRKVVTGLLRERLGFEGLVVSDALDMGAVTARAGSAASAVAALRAGVDLLVMPPDPRAARDGIVAAVRNGDLSLRQLRRAAARQGALMLHQRSERRGDRERPLRPGRARSASWELSRGAVTQVAGTCGVAHVGSRISITGPADDAATLASAARTLGLEVVPAGSAADATATRVAITGFRGGPVSGDVAVATDSPWSLGGSSAPVKIAAFGDTAGAMRAVVQVLQGRRAPGRLPVRVPGVSNGC